MSEMESQDIDILESKLAKRQLAKDLIEYNGFVRVLVQGEIQGIYDIKDFKDGYTIIDESGDEILSFKDGIVKTSGNIINVMGITLKPNTVGVEIVIDNESRVLDEFQAVELLNSLNDYLHEYRLGL